MRIYLLNPPFIEGFVRYGRWQGVVARGGTLYYPTWLSYATGVLEKEDHEVRLVDAVAWKWNKKRVLEDARKFQPDLAVVDSNFSSLQNDINIAKRLKNQTGTASVLVGPPTSQFPEKILNSGIDSVARYEYDFTLRDLAEALENEGKLETIMGISYRKNGKVFHNENRFTSSKDLNEIPFVSKVYREHLNVKDYFLNHALYPMVQIFTARGCPYSCTFCSWPQTFMGRKHRARTVENVADEFEFVADKLPEVNEIFIEDDTFVIDRKRVRQLCEELKRRKIDITWSCQSRADLDYGTMKAMKEAGCRLLDVGYESGNDQILNNINKGITTNQLRLFTKNAYKSGLKILADFVMGFPGETKQTIEQTIGFIRQIKPDLLQVAVATPIPGTEFYEWCNENGYLLTENLEESLDEKGLQKCIVSYPWLTNRDIEVFVDKALKEYYVSFSYIPIAIKRIFRENGLQELKVAIKSAKAFFKYVRRGK